MSDEEEYYYEEPEEEETTPAAVAPPPVSASKPHPFARNNPYAYNTGAMSNSSNSPLTTPRGPYDFAKAASTPTSSKVPPHPTASSAPPADPNRMAQVELEVAKRLLQSQVTVTVQRYDAHIKSLLDNYFVGIEERKLLYNASRAVAVPLLPFGGDGAEERSAAVRFERMLIATNKAVEVDLNIFRRQCQELRTDWQKEFMVVCQRASDQEKQRRDDFLNLHALCRKEVDSTRSKLKAAFANKAVELDEVEDLRRSVEALGQEVSDTREALQAARRMAEEDRSRHFKDREAIIADYSTILQTEREKFSSKVKELGDLMEEERNTHIQELTAAAKRHSRAVAEISAQLSEARDANSHYLSDASVARGEALADRKSATEERSVLTKYIRDLESALIEVGGRPDAIPSSRSASVFLQTSMARHDRIFNSSGNNANGDASHHSSLYSPRGISSSQSHLLPYQKTAIRQAQAIGIVDDMLGARSAASGYSAASPAAGSERSPFSLLPKDHSKILDDVYNKPSFLHSIRSPSAEVRPSVFGGEQVARARSRSPNTGSAGLNYSGASAPYRQPSFASPTTSAIERQRTLRNQGGALSSPSSVGGSYFSSRR